MKHRYLIYPLSHTVLAVDITDIGLPTEIYPPEGKRQMVTTLRFQTWNDAREHLLALGADEKSMEGVSTRIREAGIAVLTIVWLWKSGVASSKAYRPLQPLGFLSWLFSWRLSYG
jgi:hypothetical protein